MKIYETHLDGSIDIEARDVRPNDVIRMLVSRDFVVDAVTTPKDDEVIIWGRYLDTDGDVTEDAVRDVTCPELIYTVTR